MTLDTRPLLLAASGLITPSRQNKLSALLSPCQAIQTFRCIYTLNIAKTKL